jgi:hypothetical protein
MDDAFHVLEAKGIRVVVDLRVGHVRELTIESGGRLIAPLHTAPWVEDEQIIADQNLPGSLRFLSGDFFCAPFGISDLENAPPHGWPANSAWQVRHTGRIDGGSVARYALEKPVMGAEVLKEFILRDDHPFLYERHVFIGGHGAISVANHAMIRFAVGGTLAFSPKAYGRTPNKPLESDPMRGRSLLLYPARFDDLWAPMADGTPVDLTRYPIGSRHEDFVMLVEAEGSKLGWAAALRPDRADLFLSLKNPAVLPVTFLWLSNGGRDYRPWNGRHLGVLGVEEGCSLFGDGHKASIEPNDLSRMGVKTSIALDPQGEVEVKNVIGGIAVDPTYSGLVDMQTSTGQVVLVDAMGQSTVVSFDDRFLA